MKVLASERIGRQSSDNKINNRKGLSAPTSLIPLTLLKLSPPFIPSD